VKNAVRPLLVLKEVPVDMNENPIGVNDLITVLWNREKNREGGTRMAYRPEVDAEKCIGCEECVEVCPVDVYEIQEQKSVPVNGEECIGCESCIEVCEQDAITVTEI
jgi:NAD-dependent dihydropyrimidine dehydrogenase PreA subunit